MPARAPGAHVCGFLTRRGQGENSLRQNEGLRLAAGGGQPAGRAGRRPGPHRACRPAAHGQEARRCVRPGLRRAPRVRGPEGSRGRHTHTGRLYPEMPPEREVKGEAWTPMTADVRDRETSRTGSAAGARLVRTRSCGWNPREGRVLAVGSSRLPSCLSPFPSLLSRGDQGRTCPATRPPWGARPRARALQPPRPCHRATCTLPRAVPESGPSGRAFLGQNSQSALLVSRAVWGQIRSYTNCFLHRCSFGATVAGHEAGTAVVR